MGHTAAANKACKKVSPGLAGDQQSARSNEAEDEHSVETSRLCAKLYATGHFRASQALYLCDF